MAEKQPENAPPDTPDRETWFLSELEKAEVSTGQLLGFLADFSKQDPDQAAAWGDLLLETLIQAGATDAALAVLAWAAATGSDTPERVRTCQESARQALGAASEQRAFVDHVGFDRGLPAAECVRRLRLLLALGPGVLCYDKTWGFGLVRRVDAFYQQVEIDFDNKRNHQLSLAYAAEALQLLDDDHLLARRHLRPDELNQLVADDPAEVVRVALHSFGPMNVDALQGRLAPDLVAPDEWKRFWERARKDLKEDAHVELPAKRSEPLRLLEEALAYDDRWFTELGRERKMKTIVGRVEELVSEKEVELTDARRDVLADRLRFVARGAETSQPVLSAVALMLGERLDLSEELLGAGVDAGRWLEPDLLSKTLGALPARWVTSFLALLTGRDRERALDALLDALPRTDPAVMGEVVAVLEEEGRGEACGERFRQALENRQPSLNMLVWVARNLPYLDTWALGELPDFAERVLGALELEGPAVRSRIRSQLAEQFQRGDWLDGVLAAMNDGRRRAFLLRVKDSSAFSTLDRRSLMGQMVKREPELEAVLVSATPTRGEPDRPRDVTSVRSHRERREQLQKLISVEIPKNSREIGHARSYGDLRENFEYKAAKEAQTILLRRRQELEAALEKVQPTDFSGLPTDRVGLGTGVVLRHEDGREERFYILGQWDRDEDLGIISCESRLAQAVLGSREGDGVTVPGEHGEVACVVARVDEMPEEIRAWVQGDDG